MLFDDSGRLQVVDFGIARLVDETLGLTVTGTVLGTAGYLAPEQARGEETTAASDRYALGVVAYELLTGARPFQRGSETAEAVAHITSPSRLPRSAGSGCRPRSTPSSRVRSRRAQSTGSRRQRPSWTPSVMRSPARLQRRARSGEDAPPCFSRSRPRCWPPAASPQPSWPPATRARPRPPHNRRRSPRKGDCGGRPDDRRSDGDGGLAHDGAGIVHISERRAGDGAQRRSVRAHAVRPLGGGAAASRAGHSRTSRAPTRAISRARPMRSTTSAGRWWRSTAARRRVRTSTARSSCRGTARRSRRRSASARRARTRPGAERTGADSTRRTRPT
jgi:eukaryotic-like serine/threonine-protein kinase